MARQKVWMKLPERPIPSTISPKEKASIIAACDCLIADVLKPRFLPDIRPSEWNYCIDIHGKWAAGRYRFIQRYRVGSGENAGVEFDAPFALLSRMGVDRFDIDWMRHTGQWWKLHRNLSLGDALHTLEHDGTLHPL